MMSVRVKVSVRVCVCARMPLGMVRKGVDNEVVKVKV